MLGCVQDISGFKRCETLLKLRNNLIKFNICNFEELIKKLENRKLKDLIKLSNIESLNIMVVYLYSN